MIYIFGDSHVRSFSHIENIIPLFIGSGSKTNLRNIKVIINKINEIVDLGIIKPDDITILYFGEPDCRHQLGYGLYPHYVDIVHKKIRIVDEVVNKSFLNDCCNKYVELISKLKITPYILSVTSAYPSVIPAMVYMNNKLKEDNIDIFIDIFSKTIDNDGNIKSEFISSDFNKDPLHLNSRVRDVLIKTLVIKKIIKSSDVTKNDTIFDSYDVRDNFKKDSRFGCYVLK